MRPPAAQVVWTIEDFLRWEREQPGRHEFVGGHLYSKDRARLGHARRANLIARALDRQVTPPCEVIVERPLLVVADNAMVPDVWMTCAGAGDDATELHDAELVVEVLSPSSCRGEMTSRQAA